jgi:RNA polymerase sigma factor (sigma-70 family)
MDAGGDIMKFIIFLFLTLSSTVFAATAPARLAVVCPPKMATLASESSGKVRQTPHMTAQDEAEFSDFIVQNKPLFFNILRPLVKNKNDLEDVFQEGSLKLYRYWNGYRDIGRKRTTWAVVIFKRIGLNYIRDNKRWNSHFSETSSFDSDNGTSISVLDQADALVAIAKFRTGESTLDDLIRIQDISPLFASIDELPAIQKEAIQLQYFGEVGPSSKILYEKYGSDYQDKMPYGEMAKILNISQGALKSVLFRANETLRADRAYIDQLN